MKKISILLTIVLFLLSCGTGTSGTTPGSSASFIDQPLQGTHSGISWTLASGFAESDFFEDGAWSFKLYNVLPNSGYESYESFAYGSLDYKELMFSLPGDSETGLPLVGRTNLYFNTTTSDIKSCTFYNTENSLNTIATNGAIEILSVETGTNASVTGRMHVWYDSSGEFEVNGNFTVPINPADLP